MNMGSPTSARSGHSLRRSLRWLVLPAFAFAALGALSGCERDHQAEMPGQAAQIEHVPIKQKVGPGGTEISAFVRVPEPAEDIAVDIYYREKGKGGFSEIPMSLEPGWNAYKGSIPAFRKGKRVEYYIKVSSRDGEWLASYPAGEKGKASWISFRQKGEIWPPLMALHIGIMFAGLIAIVAALLYGVATLWNTEALPRCAYATGLASLLTFIGGVPLGILVTLQRLGPPGWEGIPIGTDITDSKTFFIVLWWIVAAVIGKGSIFSRNPAKNWARPSRFAWFVVVGGFFSIAMYLIPHSI
jgi:hypothetical protein